MRALEFGSLNDIREKYGSLRQLEEMPRDSITRPAVAFKPADPKNQVIPWNSDRALELWQTRRPYKGEALPTIFTEKDDVTKASEEIVGRNRLVLKPKGTEELMYYTMDDE